MQSWCMNTLHKSESPDEAVVDVIDVCGNINHHAAAAFAIGELAWEIHQSQEVVLDHHQRNIHTEIARRSDV